MRQSLRQERAKSATGGINKSVTTALIVVLLLAAMVATVLIRPGMGRAETANHHISISQHTKPAKVHNRAKERAAARQARARHTRALKRFYLILELREKLKDPNVQNYLLLVSLRGPSPWDGLARCETAGNWQMQGSIFGGGTGDANTTWRAFVHGLTANGERRWNDLVTDFGYPELPGWASREQQIVVDDRIKEWNHDSTIGAWGCGWAYGT